MYMIHAEVFLKVEFGHGGVSNFATLNTVAIEEPD